MRLHKDHGLALDTLLEIPLSETRVRTALGLSLLQFKLLKELTGYPPTKQSRYWLALEGLCNAAKRLREIGLSVEQASQALLTRARWNEVAYELPPSIKTNEQIETLLGLVQQRLRSVVAVKPDVSLEAQAVKALNDIYDQVVVAKLVKAIQDAGAAIGEHLDVLPILRGNDATRASRKLGEWLPLLTVDQAMEIIGQSNRDATKRFTLLLNHIATRRRERELLTVIAEQCGLAEPEVIPLLGSRLMLNPPQGNSNELASVAFLESSFWAGTTAPRVEGNFSELHDWIDRLYRLKALSAALAIDNELMQIADRVVVGSGPGINWCDMLCAAPVAGSSAWQNPQWQALLDLLWLQQPEQLSRPALGELLKRLVAPGAQVSPDTLRPLTARVDISETPETLTKELMAQAISAQSNAITTLDLRNPGKLRLAFEWLLLAKQLGADATQIALLVDQADNALAADTARLLLESKLAGEVLKTSLQKIDDSLRRQRRDKLVAYHVAQVVGRNNSDKWSDAKALYEHFLIDPQMEPCFDTRPILEAITAVQLFVQHILFGIERGITADPIIKQRWTWMRNYRVWEANRKVFLFPENWLFPELRDDKSSSFKQLESALGQGELTQDLAQNAFSAFLDDVAQIGQTHVLGMFEHVHDLIRDLYVVGRSANPPYNYYWRQCVDFCSGFMEWKPWQRIELDLEGDHVLPFVLNEELYIAWPVIQRKTGTNGSPDQWQIQLAWARYSGNAWKKQVLSRDKRTVDVESFSDNSIGFALRYEPSPVDLHPRIAIYYQSKVAENITSVPAAPDLPDPQPTFVLGPEFYGDDGADKLADLILTNPENLPDDYKGTLRIYALREKYKPPARDFELGSGAWWDYLDIFTDNKTLIDQGRHVEYFNFDAVTKVNEHFNGVRAALIAQPTWPYQDSLIREFLGDFKSKNLITINRTSAWEEFVLVIAAKSSRINIKCRTWINLKYEGGHRTRRVRQK